MLSLWRGHCRLTYEEELPLGASQLSVTVQSVTPVTRGFVGADVDVWASAAVELSRDTSPNITACRNVSRERWKPLRTVCAPRLTSRVGSYDCGKAAAKKPARITHSPGVTPNPP